MSALDKIPQSAVTVVFLEAAAEHRFPDGLLHRKSAPTTIVAQPLEGRYDVHAP